MKCVVCGKEITKDDRFCSKCGYYNKEYTGVDALKPDDLFYDQPYYKYHLPKKDFGLKTPARVFMVLGLLMTALGAYLVSPILMILSLGWSIPLTVIYFTKVSYGEKISVTFKIFCMFLVSFVGGILMIADRD